MSELNVTEHAARRWMQRVEGVSSPTAEQIAHATGPLLRAIDSARVSHRFANKTRVFVTTTGIHFIVQRGGVIVTVLGKGQQCGGCPCIHCITERSRRQRDKAARNKERR